MKERGVVSSPLFEPRPLSPPTRFLSLSVGHETRHALGRLATVQVRAVGSVDKESLPLEPLAVDDSSEHSDQETPSPDSELSSSSETESVVRSQGSTMISSQPIHMSVRNWLNILLLGFGFMLLFTAFQTSAFVQVQFGRVPC